MSELRMKDSPPGSIGACSPNGWIDSSLFVKWMSHLIAFAKPTQNKKILLIVDGHSSHKSLEAIEMARQNGIVMLCLPPHTTHRMQPLDKVFFGPLKVNYNRECDKWMVTNAGRRISQYEQASLFSAAYLVALPLKKQC